MKEQIAKNPQTVKVKRSLLEQALKIMHGWLFLIVFWPLPVSIVEFLPGDERKMLLLSVIILIPVLLSTLLIRRTRSMWSYVLGSLLVIAGMGALSWQLPDILNIAPAESLSQPSLSRMFPDGVPHTAAKITLLILTLLLTGLCMLFRGSVRIKKGQLKRAFLEMTAGGLTELSEDDWDLPTVLDLPHPVHLVYEVIVYLICCGLHDSKAYHMVFLIIFAECFLMLILRHEDRLFTFIKDHQKIANLPEETMRRIGKRVLIAAMLILLIFLLPSVFYGKEPLDEWFSRLPKLQMSVEQQEQVFTEETETSEPDPIFSELSQTKAIEWPAWAKFMFRSICCLLAIYILSLLVRELFAGLHRMNAIFSEDMEDEVVFLHREDRDENKSLFGWRIGDDTDGTTNRKIRRQYKKLVRKSSKRIPLSSETPRELEQNSGLSGIEEGRMVHEVYEKARYSRESCTEEELKQLKSVKLR